jgi:uncharacterized cupredoxin-like copper-binding protein
MTRRTAGTGLVVAAVGGTLAGTGAGIATAGDGVHAAKASLHLKAAAGGALKYNKTKLSASAGKITVTLKNPKGTHTKHGIEIEGKGIEKRAKNAKPGKSTSVTVTLKAGTYEYYCPVDGHHAAGMEGKLIVK